MAMAVGGLEALENKSLLEFCNLIKKIQSDMEDSGRLGVSGKQINCCPQI
jgi:hypothetical protein